VNTVAEANETLNDYNSVMISKLHCTSNIMCLHT